MSSQKTHSYRNRILAHIGYALQNAFSNRSQSEPQLVANLVVHLTNIVNQKIAQYFANYGIKMVASGIFIHTNPKVQFRTATTNRQQITREIGDLLIIITYKRRNGTVSRNALLLQAKKTAKYPVKPRDAGQHHLYAYWPEFTYTNSGPALNGKKRKITGPHMYNGTQYLLIGSSRKINYAIDDLNNIDFLCSFIEPTIRYNFKISIYNDLIAFPSYPKLTHYRNFFFEFYDLLFNNAGREFIYQPPGNNTNWDQVISDMIMTTASSSSVYMQRAKRVGDSLRSEGFVHLFTVGDMSQSTFVQVLSERVKEKAGNFHYEGEEPPPDVPNKWGLYSEDLPLSGISTIEIVVEEKEGQ